MLWVQGRAHITVPGNKINVSKMNSICLDEMNIVVSGCTYFEIWYVLQRFQDKLIYSGCAVTKVHPGAAKGMASKFLTIKEAKPSSLINVPCLNMNAWPIAL